MFCQEPSLLRSLEGPRDPLRPPPPPPPRLLQLPPLEPAQALASLRPWLRPSALHPPPPPPPRVLPRPSRPPAGHHKPDVSALAEHTVETPNNQTVAQQIPHQSCQPLGCQTMNSEPKNFLEQHVSKCTAMHLPEHHTTTTQSDRHTLQSSSTR